jgi:hypothetical protein
MAPEVDLTRDRLASVEYGRTPLRYPAGYRLCFIFDVNPHWLADGEGEMKAAAGALELPTPESQPRRALFSEIWDKVRQKQLPSRAEPRGRRKKAPAGELIPKFDATGHVVGFLADLFAREKFRSPLERQEFALEITAYAHNLALRLRRASTQELHVASSRGRSAATPARSDRMTPVLREVVQRLQQELAKLNRAIETLNPVAVNPAFLPRPAAAEVARLQEAIEKIAAQIEDAEGRIKMLVTGKTVAGP